MSKKKKNWMKDLPTTPSYKFFENEANKEFAGIEILEGNFAGTQFSYGVIKIGESDESDDTVPLTFTYDLIKGLNISPKNTIQEFEAVLASILMDVITKS